jgi:acyl carrier protein
VNEETLEARIREFLADNFPLGTDWSALDGDRSLIDAGVIDSTGVLELINFLEAEYGFTIPVADLVPENLDSIDLIVAYVARRVADGGAATS